MFRSMIRVAAFTAAGVFCGVLVYWAMAVKPYCDEWPAVPLDGSENAQVRQAVEDHNSWANFVCLR